MSTFPQNYNMSNVNSMGQVYQYGQNSGPTQVQNQMQQNQVQSVPQNQMFTFDANGTPIFNKPKNMPVSNVGISQGGVLFDANANL